MNLPRIVKAAAFGLAVVVAIWWNVRVFSLYAFVTVPIEFAAVIFLMIAITVVRSLCGRLHG